MRSDEQGREEVIENEIDKQLIVERKQTDGEKKKKKKEKKERKRK